jgi:NADPH2:quinone reductase
LVIPSGEMAAVRAVKAGGPDVLIPVTAPVPVPSENQVLVRLYAIGVNYADVMCRRSVHPGMPGPPIVPGCEGSGVVMSCGKGVTTHKAGNRVGVYSPWGGTYAEWVVVPENYALPLPDAMSFEEAAAFTHVYLTAFHALRTLGRATAGDWVVITAAAGGLGTALLQLCLHWEMRAIAGVGSSAKVQMLEQMGVAHFLNYSSQSLSSFVKKATDGRGADVIVETVGGHVFSEALESLAPLGTLVMAGIASGEEVKLDPLRLLSKSATFAALNLSVLFVHTPDLIRSSWTDLLAIYQTGTIRPVIGYRFALQDAAGAHRLMESRQSMGKILLQP